MLDTATNITGLSAITHFRFDVNDGLDKTPSKLDIEL